MPSHWQYLHKQERCMQMPTTLPNIKGVTTIKILGINISNNVSVCGHVNDVTVVIAHTSCARQFKKFDMVGCHYWKAHARRQCMVEALLALSRAPTAWIRHRRGIRAWTMCSRRDMADFVEDADDKLFSCILYNNEYVVNPVLPIETESTY